METAVPQHDKLSSRLAAQILADLPVYVGAGLMLSACYAVLLIFAEPPSLAMMRVNIPLYFAAVLVLGFGNMLLILMRDRPDSPIGHLRKVYVVRLVDPRFLGRLPAFALVVTMMPLFSAVKSTIPLFNSYSWDETFIAWDRALFFGYDAWQVMQPALGYPIVTAVLAFFYHLWILLPYLGTTYLMFFASAAPVFRQYVLGFFLSWGIIGSLLATLFASVGPCFLEPLFGDRHFADQMAYLRAAGEQYPVMTLAVQDLLVEWHREGENGLGAGISAMPSMHVAIALLFWLAVRTISPLYSRIFFAFFVMTWVSSVHLAYHYAVDGLLSVIAVWIIWRFSETLLCWWDARIAKGSHPTLRTNTVPAE